MEEQRTRGRAAQKKTVIEVDEDFGVTEFVGYETLATNCRILSFLDKVERMAARMFSSLPTDLFTMLRWVVKSGTRRLEIKGLETPIRITSTVKRGSAYYHQVHSEDLAALKAAQLGWTLRKGLTRGLL